MAMTGPEPPAFTMHQLLALAPPLGVATDSLKDFRPRKPKPRPILFSISPVSLSKIRPSWDTAFSCPKFIVIEGKY
jgi:hypothetical protein